MLPFPGESLALDQAADLSSGADWSLSGDVTFQAGARTLAAGPWVGWVAPYYSYLEAGADAVLSWVVVVDSGTATVTVEEGLDPDGSDPYITPGTSLGTFTLTAGVNVIPSTITAATLIETLDYLVARLTPVTGSAVVSQVKLRVWPPSGALGGWTVSEGFDFTGASWAGRNVYGDDIGPPGSSDSDPGTAWDAAAPPFEGAVLSGGPVTSVGSLGGTVFIPVSGRFDAVLADAAPFTYAASGLIYGRRGVVIAQPDPEPVAIERALVAPGVIRPPDVVPGDDLSLYLELLDVPTVTWGGPLCIRADSNWLSEHNAGNGGALEVIVTDVGAKVGYSGDGTWVGRLTTEGVPLPTSSLGLGSDGYPFSPGEPGFCIDLPPAKAVVVNTAMGWWRDVPPYPGGTPSAIEPITIGGSAQIYTDGLPDSVVTVPPFRHWSPTAPARQKVRQLHRDDGQGVTPRRHFGGASRANTGRHFGYD